MTYTLEQLLSDKALMKNLLEGVFFFSDEAGDFFAVDFEKESMRHNHITVFEVLYSLGGDALFEKILQEGNTCLANTPDAAKVGVKEIAGAKGWYLKTNASAFAAFSSILYALAALDNTDRFTFSVEEETSLYRVVSKASEGYTTGLQLDYDEIYKVEKTEDGSFAVVCAEDGTQVTFIITEFSGTKEINKFHKVEPICTDTEEFDEETGDYKYKYKAIAYKYKLAENGKWGFFNGCFSQFIPPCFDDVLITVGNNGGKLIAYEILDSCRFDDIDLFVPSKERECHFYFSENDAFELVYSTMNMSYACKISEKFIPTEKSRVSKTILPKENKEIVFYSPTGSPYIGFVFIKTNYSQIGLGFGKATIDGNAVKREKMVLKGENTRRGLPVAQNSIVTVEDYAKLYSDEEPAFRAIEQLYNENYIVERDGYLGIAKMRNGKEHVFCGKTNVLELDEMVTPYAFTGLQMALQDSVIVERFGKKGLFRIRDKKYVIPCDYDELVSLGWSKYKVCKADFTGVIQVVSEPRWIEKLHRES